MTKRCRLGAVLLGMLAVVTGAQAESPQTQAPQTVSPPVSGFSADALYNLGNAYERAGKPGMAILNYERAALLAPNDPDIQANLSAARVASNLPAEQANQFERAATLVSPSVAAWLAVLGLLVIGASVLAGRVTVQPPWLRGVGVLVGLLLIAVTVANGLVMWPKLHRAVVLVAGTPVRATPAPLGDALFNLPEGTAVRILGDHQDFVFVQIKPEMRGWVARASIATVVP